MSPTPVLVWGNWNWNHVLQNILVITKNEIIYLKMSSINASPCITLLLSCFTVYISCLLYRFLKVNSFSFSLCFSFDFYCSFQTRLNLVAMAVIEAFQMLILMHGCVRVCLWTFPYKIWSWSGVHKSFTKSDVFDVCYTEVVSCLFLSMILFSVLSFYLMLKQTLKGPSVKTEDR